MDASSSSRFYSAKAEESPSTVVDSAAELETMTMVGAEGASTSGRSEYYSARCEAMMRSRGKFSDDVALEIEFSEPHWSEVSRLEVAPQSAEEQELNRENRELFEQLTEEYPSLFKRDLGIFTKPLDRMIAKGGQAEIYEFAGIDDLLMKVFERGTLLRDLRRLWPLPVLKEAVHQCVIYAGMLEDGRFAFLMTRCWGDLRKLIDQVMQEKIVDGVEGPPFPYKWDEYHGRTFYPEYFIHGIAENMLNLHEKGISHRDLKASNILFRRKYLCYGGYDVRIYRNVREVLVADFECSIGVSGTGFWRAPEVLLALGKQETITHEQWEKADVYNYGMVCFEIVTGRIPFDGELENTKANRQLVIEGKRPQLPSDLDDAMKDLITKCWAPNPRLRPTFSEIVDMVDTISTKQCEFRLFGVGDELPPQYRLATVEEVDDYPIALEKAMHIFEIANLANGSVLKDHAGFRLRWGRVSNARHKLARVHH